MFCGLRVKLRNSDGGERQRVVTVASPLSTPETLLWVVMGWEDKTARAAQVTGPPSPLYGGGPHTSPRIQIASPKTLNPES